MKKLLILTGPQGSGNHIFSRVLSTHPNVGGWKELLSSYWIPSDQETFAKFWVYPELLTEQDFDGFDFWLANVSCPFFYDGIRYVPKILEVANRASLFGITVEIAIVVRDQTINSLQQERVGGQITLSIAQDYYYTTLVPSNYKIHFIDHEAFFLHKSYYLKWLSSILDFPILYDSNEVMKFIETDANSKYVQSIETHWLDSEIRHGRKPFTDR